MTIFLKSITIRCQLLDSAKDFDTAIILPTFSDPFFKIEQQFFLNFSCLQPILWWAWRMCQQHFLGICTCSWFLRLLIQMHILYWSSWYNVLLCNFHNLSTWWLSPSQHMHVVPDLHQIRNYFVQNLPD